MARPSSAVRPIGILGEPGEDSAFKDLLRITGMTQGNDRTFTDSSGLAMSLPSSTSAANARSGEFANRSSDSSKDKVRLIDDRRQTQLLHQQHHREPLSEQQEFEQKQVWDSQRDQWWDDQQLTQMWEDQHQQEQEQNSNADNNNLHSNRDPTVTNNIGSTSSSSYSVGDTQVIPPPLPPPVVAVPLTKEELRIKRLERFK